MTLPARRYLVVAALGILGVLASLLAPALYSTLVDTSAKDRIEAEPPPHLFGDATVAPLGRRVERQVRPAHTLMARWWGSHDRRAHDRAFAAWLERTLPGPPSTSARAVEVGRVQKLARTRTAAGVRAATWLEAYGKKDVWKLYAHDQAEMLPTARGEATKQSVKDMLKLAKTVSDDLGTRYQQSAPYVLHPALRPDHTVVAGQVCPCSYPSRHAAAGAAATTFLAGLVPHRAEEYRWTAAEIDYSRVYMAGHVPSDITGGALLGDLIGEYFLVTRAHRPVPRA